MLSNLLNTYMSSLENSNSYNTRSIKEDPFKFTVSNYAISPYDTISYLDPRSDFTKTYIDAEVVDINIKSGTNIAASKIYYGDIEDTITSTSSISGIRMATVTPSNIDIVSTVESGSSTLDVGIHPDMQITSTYMQTAVYKDKPVYYQDYNVHTTSMYAVGSARVSIVRTVYLDDIDFSIVSYNKSSAIVHHSLDTLPIDIESTYVCNPTNIAAAMPIVQESSVDSSTTVFMLYSFEPELQDSIVYLETEGYYFRGIDPEDILVDSEMLPTAFNLEVGVSALHTIDSKNETALNFMSNGNPAIVVRSWINLEEPYGTIVIPLDPYL